MKHFVRAGRYNNMRAVLMMADVLAIECRSHCKFERQRDQFERFIRAARMQHGPGSDGSKTCEGKDFPRA
jgi:hypothetical protein